MTTLNLFFVGTEMDSTAMSFNFMLLMKHPDAAGRKLRKTGVIEATEHYTMLDTGYPNPSSPRYQGFKIVSEGSSDRHPL